MRFIQILDLNFREMRAVVPTGFERFGQSDNPLVFKNLDGNVFELHVIDENLVRVTHVPPRAQSLLKSHALDPGINSNEINVQGILRNQTSAQIPVKVQKSDSGYTLETKKLRIIVSLPDLTLSWHALDSNSKEPFLKDLAFRAYEYDKKGGVHHYTQQRRGDLHFGLGERVSPLTLNGRRFRLECCDSLGYNAQSTDPLYKLIPYYLTLNSETKEAFGIYYDSLSSGTLDFGCEIDALWGNYQAYRTHHGSLDYYVFYGPLLSTCVETFASLVGKPALVPKYALGYLASSMGYAEADNAQELIEKFPDLCAKWDIPCDLLHLSSGYTGIFENLVLISLQSIRSLEQEMCSLGICRFSMCRVSHSRNRFKNPERMFDILNKAGIKTVANVKPWLLTIHPEYEAMKKSNGFVIDSDTNGPSTTRLWSGGAGETCSGSYFDFSSSSGRKFWKQGVRSLLETGVTGIWNDNNEFSLNDDEHLYALNGGSTVGLSGRLLQTVLMASASYEALVEHDSEKRPFLITRAGAPGVHRFASQTWSGDNFSSWDTLKHNIPMGLNAGLSLLTGYGHDVGGFFGPRPGPELFVRWIQNGIFHPRFCIHSWKSEGITEPWMYPEVFI